MGPQKAGYTTNAAPHPDRVLSYCQMDQREQGFQTAASALFKMREGGHYLPIGSDGPCNSARNMPGSMGLEQLGCSL